MLDRTRERSFLYLALAAAVACLVVAGCGSRSSSGDAKTLLQQTFSGPHKINSGQLSFNITVDPSGSRALSGPFSLTVAGPFQSRGTGQLPQSNFDVSITGFGQTGRVGVLSTGNAGYVTLKGTSYQLPHNVFQQLESSFAQVASPTGGSSGTLSKLGIQPLHWLTNPTVVGDEHVGGADTTHITAGVNVTALLADFNTFLERAASLGVSGTNSLRSGLSPQTRTRIAAAIRNPSFDVWTGTSDKTMRRLLIRLTIPVTGTLSSELGGLRAADVGLSIQYANLNQPQTITAPQTVRPYAEFASKITTIVRAFETSLQGGGTLGNSGGASSNGGSAGSAANVQRYSQCIQAAGNDVSKMERCASLLNSG